MLIQLIRTMGATPDNGCISTNNIYIYIYIYIYICNHASHFSVNPRPGNMRIFLCFTMICATYGCHYTSWMNSLSCYGLEVREIPDYDPEVKLNTRHLDILNTSVRLLPDFRDWRDLHTIDIRDNLWINCSQVLALKASFHVSTDCDDRSGFTGKRHEKNTLEYYLCIIFLIFTPIPFVLLWIRKQRKDRYQIAERKNTENDQLTEAFSKLHI